MIYSFFFFFLSFLEKREYAKLGFFGCRVLGLVGCMGLMGGDRRGLEGCRSGYV